MENENQNQNNSAAEIAAAASGVSAFPLSVTFDSKEFLAAIKALIHAASKDENRFILNGLFFDVKAESQSCNIVATDGRRLAAVKLPINAACDLCFIVTCADIKFWLKEKSLKKLKDLTLYFNKENLKGRLHDSLNFRAIEGNYPNYHQVIPRYDVKISGRLSHDQIEIALNDRESAWQSAAEIEIQNNQYLQSLVQFQTALYEKEKAKKIRVFKSELDAYNSGICFDATQGEAKAIPCQVVRTKLGVESIYKSAPNFGKLSINQNFLSDFLEYCEILEIQNSLNFSNPKEESCVMSPVFFDLDFRAKTSIGFLYIIMPQRVI